MKISKISFVNLVMIAVCIAMDLDLKTVQNAIHWIIESWITKHVFVS